MKPWSYPARIERHAADGDAATWIVTFDDIPECLTEGATAEEAEVEAADALATAVAAYLKRGLPVPPPRAAGKGEIDVALEPGLAARAALASIMASDRISKVALAARMGKDEKAVRRMLEPKGSSLDMVMKALAAVGARPVLSVERAPGAVA